MKTIDSNIEELESAIGYTFQNKALIRSALTHSSYMNEQKINKWDNYQRLEYLGDAVLELVSSEYIFHNHPNMKEGEMSKLRASMVCEPSLAICARDLHIGEYILLGKGEENCGGRERDSILSDVFEAIIGAIYLDGGFEKAREHILHYVFEDLDERQLFIDSKSLIQEKIQAMKHSEMHYELLSENGPEHHKEFEVGLYINGECVSIGKEFNKKRAEQKAAYLALKKLNNNSDEGKECI